MLDEHTTARCIELRRLNRKLGVAGMPQFVDVAQVLIVELETEEVQDWPACFPIHPEGRR
jgi:hypothetical protein